MKADLNSSVQRPNVGNMSSAKLGNIVGQPSIGSSVKSSVKHVVSKMDNFRYNSTSVRPIKTTSGC